MLFVYWLFMNSLFLGFLFLDFLIFGHFDSLCVCIFRSFDFILALLLSGSVECMYL